MDFLGHLISQSGIAPLSKDLKQLPHYSHVQLTRYQVFVKMVGYYWQLIHYLAKLAEPYVRLLIKKVPFSWDEEKYSAFDALREALASYPVLVHPDFDNPFVLFANASNVAVGAILAQLDENKFNHPIAY